MKNSFVLGMGLGLIAPLLAFLLSQFGMNGSDFLNSKPLGVYVVAAAVNLILIRQSYKKGYEQIGQGLVLSTFLGIVWLIFNKHVLPPI